MELERTFDYDLVQMLMTVEEVYDSLGDDHLPPIEHFKVNTHPEIWYVLVRGRAGLFGLFVLIPKNAVCWEAHVIMLPWATTRERWQAARALPLWLGEYTGCRRLTAEVPSCNRPAIVYATHGTGMHNVGRHKRAFLKGGQLQDLIILGRAIGEV